MGPVSMTLSLFLAWTVFVGVAGIPFNSCITGTDCDRCDVSSVLVTEEGPVHACCPLCSPYMSAGYMRVGDYEGDANETIDDANVEDDDYDEDGNDGEVVPYCSCEYEIAILGDCWKGSECDICEGSNVMMLGQIPVCCQHCADVDIVAAVGDEVRYCMCSPGAGISTNITAQLEDSGEAPELYL